MAIQSDEPNANSRLTIIFSKKPLLNPAKTAAEGREIYDDTIFIKKLVPGDALNIIERPIYDSDKREFPMHWAHFMNTQGSDEMISGTPLSEWALVTRSQAEELRAMRFYTVEQVADASDAALQKMGMSAGMSPYAFRDKAKAFLKQASIDADNYKSDEEIRLLKEQNDSIKAESDAKIAKMQAQMDAMMNMMSEKKPRGRKAKEVETTEI